MFVNYLMTFLSILSKNELDLKTVIIKTFTSSIRQASNRFVERLAFFAKKYTIFAKNRTFYRRNFSSQILKKNSGQTNRVMRRSKIANFVPKLQRVAEKC